MEETFGGKLHSVITCCYCYYQQRISEDFLDLSLPIPTSMQSHQKDSTATSNITTKANPPKEREVNQMSEQEMGEVDENDNEKSSPFFAPIDL